MLQYIVASLKIEGTLARGKNSSFFFARLQSQACVCLTSQIPHIHSKADFAKLHINGLGTQQLLRLLRLRRCLHLRRRYFEDPEANDGIGDCSLTCQGRLSDTSSKKVGMKTHPSQLVPTSGQEPALCIKQKELHKGTC